MDKLLSVGKILNFHGIHGEVKVGYTPDKKEQLESIKEFIAVKGSVTISLAVESIRFHKNFALMKFKDYNSINEVIELKDAYLKVPRSEIQEYLEEDEFYVDDLIGMDAFDTDENYIGVITNVIKSGGSDLLSVKDKTGKEHLIPFVKELVPDINVEEKKVTVKTIPGLLDELSE